MALKNFTFTFEFCILKCLYENEMFGLIEYTEAKGRGNTFFICDVEEKAVVSYLDALMM